MEPHGSTSHPVVRVILVLVAMGVAVFASVASTSSNEATKVGERGDETSGSGSGSGASQTFGVGDVVALGDWQVVVHGIMDPLVPTNDFLGPDPGTRWVAVDAEVTNNSSRAQTVSSVLCFEMQDAQNQSYLIEITGEPSMKSPDGEVDPGGSRRGTLTYEVPEGATGLELRFKCDLLSSGSATIALG